jgi:hypothetical protein
VYLKKTLEIGARVYKSMNSLSTYSVMKRALGASTIISFIDEWGPTKAENLKASNKGDINLYELGISCWYCAYLSRVYKNGWAGAFFSPAVYRLVEVAALNYYEGNLTLLAGIAGMEKDTGYLTKDQLNQLSDWSELEELGIVIRSKNELFWAGKNVLSALRNAPPYWCYLSQIREIERRWTLQQS